MVVGVCRLVLSLSGCFSLKEKRRLIRPLMTRLHHEYKVAVAEIESQDVLERAVIAFAAVSNDRRILNALIDRVVDRIETMADVVVLEHDFEITNY